MNLNENRVALFASLLEMLVVAYPLLEERLKDEGKTFDFAEFIRAVATLTETETFPTATTATTFPPIPYTPYIPYTHLPSINPTFPTETVPPISPNVQLDVWGKPINTLLNPFAPLPNSNPPGVPQERVSGSTLNTVDPILYTPTPPPSPIEDRRGAFTPAMYPYPI